jgi:hypothetical protein
MITRLKKRVVTRELLKQLRQVEDQIEEAEEGVACAQESIEVKHLLEEVAGISFGLTVEKTAEGLRQNLEALKRLRSDIIAILLELGSPVPIK